MARDIKHASAKMSPNSYSPQNLTDHQLYELPDKQSVLIGQEAFGIPEKFFSFKEGEFIKNLEKFCLQNFQQNQNQSCLRDLIITGGNSSIQGFPERLMHEISLTQIQSIFDQKQSQFFFSSKSIERANESWVVGSIIGCIGSLNCKRIEKHDLLEFGESLMKRWDQQIMIIILFIMDQEKWENFFKNQKQINFDKISKFVQFLKFNEN